MATGTGNLPNPSMSFTPFDILTAAEQNDLVENIESLAGGTGIGDGSVDTAAIADGAVTSAKIDSTTLGFGNYSLTEADTRFTWVDGKSIYKKTVNITFVSGTTTRTSAHGIANVDYIVDVRAVISGAPLSFYAATTFFRYIRVDATNVIVEQAGGSLPTGSLPVTIWYTKT